MKKYLILILAICVLALYASTSVAHMTVMNISGRVPIAGGVCSSCDPVTDVYDPVSQSANYTMSSTETKCVKWVVGSQTCVTGITVEIKDEGGTGNMTVSIYSDSGGDPDDVVTGCTATLTSAEIGDTQTTEAFTFAAIQALDAATYWICGDSDYNVDLYYESGASGVDSKYWNGSSWADSSYDPEYIVKGCSP